MEKVDLRRTLASFRARVGVVDVLEVPPSRYLVVDGEGDPNASPAYAEALAALYPVAYATKAVAREQLSRDHVVPPLEGLWWADDLTAFTSARDKTRWRWTLMLMVPDWVGDDLVGLALERVGAKPSPPPVDRLRLETLAEGLCVQTLHVGPYDDEGPVLAHLHDEVLPARGLRPTGRHHEVYLRDARRTAPARLRTILRQPVEPLQG